MLLKVTRPSVAQTASLFLCRQNMYRTLSPVFSDTLLLTICPGCLYVVMIKQVHCRSVHAVVLIPHCCIYRQQVGVDGELVCVASTPWHLLVHHES